ncbi:MAG: hypothetical protein H7Y59_02305 [Anaerolineales bacterium]|nr:hypothetical protein [Anaerolineales bacterium]
MVTKSFETKITIYVALLIILLLAGCIGFVMQGQLATGAWMLIILMVLVNFLNMAFYGISSSSSAAYIIPILLAMFSIGANAGVGVAILGCVFVFIVPILQSRGILKSILPFEISSLTFDAPVLTLIYILVTLVVYTWASSSKNIVLN